MNRYYITANGKTYEYKAIDIVDLICYVLPTEMLPNIRFIEAVD